MSMQFTNKEFYNRKGIKTLPYWRKPTKSEIKFGYGAIHHRDFDIEDCYTKEGIFKLKFKAKDDGLLYYSSKYEGDIIKSNIKFELTDMYTPNW